MVATKRTKPISRLSFSLSLSIYLSISPFFPLLLTLPFTAIFYLNVLASSRTFGRSTTVQTRVRMRAVQLCIVSPWRGERAVKTGTERADAKEEESKCIKDHRKRYRGFHGNFEASKFRDAFPSFVTLDLVARSECAAKCSLYFASRASPISSNDSSTRYSGLLDKLIVSFPSITSRGKFRKNRTKIARRYRKCQFSRPEIFIRFWLILYKDLIR